MKLWVYFNQLLCVSSYTMLINYRISKMLHFLPHKTGSEKLFPFFLLEQLKCKNQSVYFILKSFHRLILQLRFGSSTTQAKRNLLKQFITWVSRQILALCSRTWTEPCSALLSHLISCMLTVPGPLGQPERNSLTSESGSFYKFEDSLTLLSRPLSSDLSALICAGKLSSTSSHLS